MNRVALAIFPAIFAIYMPTCAPSVRPTAMPWDAPLAELWQRPSDLPARDLFDGPWGSGRAPDPRDIYTLIGPKNHGTNPGVIVADSEGRVWHVKQPPHNDQGEEGPIEVALSRVLSAVGYHQPPVYYLPAFTIRDNSGTHSERGGRFRLNEKSIKHVGDWSWQQNPFVGTRPYQGLLVILMMFNSSDLKNENNALYEVEQPRDGVARWYVVRDLGTALGETGRLAPKRGDADIFERHPFITGVKGGFVEFSYHGWHQELVRQRITQSDVRWASELLQRLTERQWADAFRAGGYQAAIAGRFIRRLRQKIADGLQMSEGSQ
jgi:hypothetical protein